MSEEDTGSSDPGPKPEPEQQKPKSKPAKVPDEILKCSNGCGFMTRYPKGQALKEKDAKTAKEPYLCPNCDNNGMSGKLVPYP